MSRKAKTAKSSSQHRQSRVLPAEFKLRVVQEAMRGSPHAMVGRVFGVSTAAVSKWLRQFRKHGVPGLENRRNGRNKASPSPAKTAPRERVVALRKENEDWGTRRIRDVLRRCVSTSLRQPAREFTVAIL